MSADQHIVVCMFCDSPATKLCDKLIVKRGELIDIDDATCDNPICDLCAETQGKIFDYPKAGAIDSLDYCPHHSGAAKRSFIKPVR